MRIAGLDHAVAACRSSVLTALAGLAVLLAVDRLCQVDATPGGDRSGGCPVAPLAGDALGRLPDFDASSSRHVVLSRTGSGRNGVWASGRPDTPDQLILLATVFAVVLPVVCVPRRVAPAVVRWPLGRSPAESVVLLRRLRL
jgi:hypothetical protein